MKSHKTLNTSLYTKIKKHPVFWAGLTLMCALIVITLIYPFDFKSKQLPHKYHFLHFGTVIQITTSSTSPKLSANTINQIDQLLENLHYKWHPWRDGGLKILNTQLASQKPFEVNTEINNIIIKSQNLYEISLGYFNPAIGKLVQLWGFHNDNPQNNTKLSRVEAKQNQQNINEIIKNMPSPYDIKMISNNCIINTNKFLQLDLSGFIKADAALKIKDVLMSKHISNAIINIGGDINIMGHKDSNTNWTIASKIPSKTNNDEYIKIKVLDGESIATSGTDARNYNDQQSHQLRHHIINPKTGMPADGFDSVTVIHKDPYIADAAATALLIAGKTGYQEITNSMGVDKYIVVNKGQYIISKKLEPYLL